MKPKVFILIATGNLSGPGKGLIQFLKEAKKQNLNYVLSNFLQRNQTTFEFLEVAQKHELNIKLLKQVLWIDPTLIWQAYSLCRDEGCNIIQTHGYKGHIIGYILSRFTNIRWVAVAHGWTQENKKVLFYNKLERFLFRFSDFAVVVSQPLYEVISGIRGKNKVTRKILNAVDPDELQVGIGGDAIRKHYKIDKNDIVISVFGRLSSEKGQLVLLRAFKNVKSCIENVKLMIVGEGPDEVSLKAETKKLDLEEDVIFCGYQQLIRDYYEAAEIVVVPSFSEGLPNVILEAMCLSKPVLATDVGSVYEIINDGVNGWIIPPGNVDVMAEKLKELIINIDISKKVGATSRSMLFPKFSPKHRACKLLSVYDEMMGQ